MKKGTRVEFKYTDGRIGYGVVSKGGNVKNTVILDGAEQQVKGNPKCFKKSNHPLPKDEPNVMDNYSIKAWKEIDGHGDSLTFSAKIYKDGKHIITVMNDGWGGINSYHEVVNGALAQFIIDCRDWVIKLGCPNMMEPEDVWVEWWETQRPYGVTAKSEIEKYIEIFKRSSKSKSL